MYFASKTDYLLECGQVLAGKVKDTVLVRADQGNSEHPAFNDLLRSPLDAQQVVISGLFRQILEKRFAYLCAEMGWGKTYMSIAITYLLWLERYLKKPGHSILVICPPHLTTTWVEEIALTLPKNSIKTFLIGRMVDGKEEEGCREVEWDTQTCSVRAKGKPFPISLLKDERIRGGITGADDPEPKLCFWVGSKETLKLGAEWREAIGKRRMMSKEYRENPRKEAHYLGQVETGRLYFCPARIAGCRYVVAKNGLVLGCDRHGQVFKNAPVGTYSDDLHSYFSNIGHRVVEPQDGESRLNYLRRKLNGRTDEVLVCPDSGVFIEKLPKNTKTSNCFNRYHRGARTIFDEKRNRFCDETKVKDENDSSVFTPWWQFDETGMRRWAPGEFISRSLKGFFSTLIADEAHLFNNAQSAQGALLNRLCSATSEQIFLTGTMTNGSATALWSPLWRLNAERMKALGYGLDDGSGGIRKFGETYGLVEEIVKYHQPTDNRCSRARKSVDLKLRPGIMPQVHAVDFGRGLLMELCVFATLDMISDNLPRLEESVRLATPTDGLFRCYRECAGQFRQLWSTNRALAKKALGHILTILTNYLDKPFGWEPLEIDGVTVVNPVNLDPDVLYPKEKLFLDFVKAELKLNRRILTFVHFQKHGVIERLVGLCRERGIQVEFLSSAVPPAERKNWFRQAVKRGVEVVFCNPECVATGLTLLDFPTLVFYQSGRNPITNTQAEKRSYRIGQKNDVKIVYMAYQDTIQTITLKLMAKKKAALQALQGIFAEGWVDFGEDVSYAIARELVRSGTVNDDDFWNKLVSAGRNEEQAEEIVEGFFDDLFALFETVSDHSFVETSVTIDNPKQQFLF